MQRSHQLEFSYKCSAPQDLPRQVGQVFTCKECNPYQWDWIARHKIYEKQAEEFYVAGMNKLPTIPFGREQGITDLANRIAVAWHADGFRRKFARK